MIIVTKGDNTQAWCTMCDSEAPAVVEVAEDVFGCEECLGRLMRELAPVSAAMLAASEEARSTKLAPITCSCGGVLERKGALPVTGAPAWVCTDCETAHGRDGVIQHLREHLYAANDELAKALVGSLYGRSSEVSIGYVDADTASLVVDVDDGQGTG